jgi:hypothetical protein
MSFSVKWTDQGMRQVKDSPNRLDQAKSALTRMGGQFKAIYMTLGEYDLVAVYEAPDDAVGARFSLMLLFFYLCAGRFDRPSGECRLGGPQPSRFPFPGRRSMRDIKAD